MGFGSNGTIEGQGVCSAPTAGLELCLLFNNGRVGGEIYGASAMELGLTYTFKDRQTKKRGKH